MKIIVAEFFFLFHDKSWAMGRGGSNIVGVHKGESTFSYLSKLIFVLKSWNKQIFSDPCKIREQNLKTVQDPVQKQY